jgi:hypothetical protein
MGGQCSIRHSLTSAPLNQITVPREWENPSSVTHSLTPQTSAHRDFVPTPAVRPSTAGCPQTSSDTAARCLQTLAALRHSPDTDSRCLGSWEDGCSLRHSLPSAADLGAQRLCYDTSCSPQHSRLPSDIVRDRYTVPADAGCSPTLARHRLTVPRELGGRVLPPPPTPVRRRPRRSETPFRQQLPAPAQLAARRPRPTPLHGACGRWLLSDSRPTPTNGASGAGRMGAPSVTNSRPPQTSAFRDSLPTPAARPSTAGCSPTSSDTDSRCFGSWEDGCSLRHQLPSAADLGTQRLPSYSSCPPQHSWLLADLVRDR